MKSDAELLHAYASGRGEAEFTAFVERHVSFVYNTALRRIGGDAHGAGEITQRVFIEAARRAATLARHPSVAGWLHVATRHATLNLLRAEARQRARDTVAYEMNHDGASDGERVRWEQLQPLIDRALDELGDRDRQAILSRFFEQQGFRQIGDHLQISENAARMRVDRALEKLRQILRRHGIESTAAALAGGLTQQVTAAVPAGLTSSICSAAVAQAPALGIVGVSLLTMTKVKTGLLIAAMAAVIVTPPLLQLRANHNLRAQIGAELTRASIAESDHQRLTNAVSTNLPGAPAAEVGELAELQARLAILRQRLPGVVDADMKPPENRGWQTPDAALETIQWAFLHHEWRTLASALTYDAKTRAQAETFYAGLLPTVHSEFPSVDQFFAHAWYVGSQPNGSYTLQLFDVVSTELVDGPAPIEVRAWGRDALGRERGTVVRMERGPNGWGLSAPISTEIISKLIGGLDPSTGRFRPVGSKSP